MERENSTRQTLIRANPLTCTAHVPGRVSTALSCQTCDGTGYLGGNRSDIPKMALLGSPYNTVYYIFGDIQEGHGLRGSGGATAFTDGDRGVEELGDAVFYANAQQRDPITGIIVLPLVAQLPRPDRIIRTEDSQVFTVIRALDQGIGTSPLFKAFILGIGIQGAAAMSIPQ